MVMSLHLAPLSASTEKKREEKLQVHSHGRMGSEEEIVMVISSELLQPGICSTMKVNHLLMIRSLWLYPKVALHLVCSQAKGMKGNPATPLSLRFPFSAKTAFPFVAIIIHIHYNIYGIK